jgi:thiol-disulfide isomerase/thioredoxin
MPLAYPKGIVMLNRLLTIVTCLGLIALSTTVRAEEFAREGTGALRAAKDALEGKAPPALTVTGWLNTNDQPVDLKQFQGKVVLIDFWGVWCPPCRQAIPHLKEMYEQNREKGLVVIGIHTSTQGSAMADFAERSEIPYPVAVDVNNATINAFHVDSYPDYYLLDRKGNLRFADLKNPEVDRAVQALLAEE